MESKLEKKVEFFKEHLNSEKSADVLEQEFETWYEDVYKKQQYAEYLKQLKEDIQKESEIKLEFLIGPAPSSECSYVASGNWYISRYCTLEAFVNIVALRRAKENKTGKTRIYFKTYDSSCMCEINNIGEIVEKSQSCWNNWNTLIATKGKYTIYSDDIECYEVHAYNYVEITKRD